VERRLPSPRDPAHICEEKARALRVWEAVESLPPVQRDAIELCRIYELPRAVVAAQLGLTLNQLKRAIFQGVHTMKERLGR
jgi:DNA-directed RNA polymerase specialized sigma24 family protein